MSFSRILASLWLCLGLVGCGVSSQQPNQPKATLPQLETAVSVSEYVGQMFRVLATHTKGISDAQRKPPPVEAVTTSKSCPPGGGPIGDQVPEAQATPMSLCQVNGQRRILFSPKYAQLYEQVSGPGSLRQLILQLFQAHLLFEERKARGIPEAAPDDPVLVACQEGRVVGGLLNAGLISREGEGQTGLVSTAPDVVAAYEFAKREGCCP